MLNDVNEYLERTYMSSDDWETLLTAGWDRVGTGFFHRRFDHYRLLEDWLVVYELMPLRYRLADFKFSKSQRDIIKKNKDLKVVFQPIDINEEKMQLFDKWYQKRFARLGNIWVWLTTIQRPLPIYEICFYKNDKLIAATYFDITPQYQYSILAFYDPDEHKRSLGTYTLLCEIMQGINTGKTHHYPGHSYHEKSMYDYKKLFYNMEHFDWETRTWQDIPRGTAINYIV